MGLEIVTTQFGFVEDQGTRYRNCHVNPHGDDDKKSNKVKKCVCFIYCRKAFERELFKYFSGANIDRKACALIDTDIGFTLPS